MQYFTLNPLVLKRSSNSAVVVSSSNLYLLAAFFPKPSARPFLLFSLLFRGIPSSVGAIRRLFARKSTEMSIKRIGNRVASRVAREEKEEERSGWNRMESVRWEAGMSEGMKRCGIKLETASDVRGIHIKRVLKLWKNRPMSYKRIRRIAQLLHEAFGAFASSYVFFFGRLKMSQTKRKARASSSSRRKVREIQRPL